MATRTVKKPAKINLHSSVSNHDEEAAGGTRRPTSNPPSEGSDCKGLKPGADGCEALAGFKLMAAETAVQAAAALDAKAPDMSKLRDVGEAAFGSSQHLVETVHGVNNRVKIANPSVYPWRAMASLLITAADNSRWIGTGWFISPRTLITAGHCVFIKGSGVAGRDGWLRYGNCSDADLRATVGNIAGYPGDKPGGTMWYDARRIASVTSRKVFYDIDTAGGQSGAAVYRVVNGAHYAFAVHACGGGSTHSGTRINAEVFANLTAWKA